MSEIRQRWRLVFARDAQAQFLSHLDAVRLWERAFRRGDIPISRSEGFSPRPRLVFAAPLQLGMLAEHELADIFLEERLTLVDLRGRLAAGMPRGYRVVDLHDVWAGAPALAPQLVAADYRMTLLNVERDRLEAACERLLEAERLPRRRSRDGRPVAYDLRPLLLDLRARPAELPTVGGDAARSGPWGDAIQPAAGVWMRLRHSQERGSGRAEEVVAALANEMGLAVRPAAGAAGQEERSEPGEQVPTPGPPAEPGLQAPHIDSAEAGSGLAEAGQPERRSVEAVHAVRERLWLRDELDPEAPKRDPSARRSDDD